MESLCYNIGKFNLIMNTFFFHFAKIVIIIYLS